MTGQWDEIWADVAHRTNIWQTELCLENPLSLLIAFNYLATFNKGHMKGDKKYLGQEGPGLSKVPVGVGSSNKNRDKASPSQLTVTLTDTTDSRIISPYPHWYKRFRTKDFRPPSSNMQLSVVMWYLFEYENWSCYTRGLVAKIIYCEWGKLYKWNGNLFALSAFFAKIDKQ